MKYTQAVFIALCFVAASTRVSAQDNSTGKVKQSTVGAKNETGDPNGVDPAIVPPQNAVSDTQIYNYVEEMPKTSYDMPRYLQQHLQYPDTARKYQIQGRVMVQFIVNANGTLSDVRAVRGIGGGCDEEAVRVVKGMPKWIPARQNGRPVRVRYTLPINFIIQ